MGTLCPRRPDSPAGTVLLENLGTLPASHPSWLLHLASGGKSVGPWCPTPPLPWEEPCPVQETGAASHLHGHDCL